MRWGILPELRRTRKPSCRVLDCLSVVLERLETPRFLVSACDKFIYSDFLVADRDSKDNANAKKLSEVVKAVGLLDVDSKSKSIVVRDRRNRS